MKKIKFLAISALGLAPLLLSAQERDFMIGNDEVAYASVFAGDFSLLLSILIGIMATFLVFRAARRMGGGLFGSVLQYIGIGMIFIILGTIATVLDAWYLDFLWDIANTAFFALGYIFMVLGANKLLKGIINT